MDLDVLPTAPMTADEVLERLLAFDRFERSNHKTQVKHH